MTNDPLIGKQFSNFRLERPLGQGGTARVYYGTDVVLQRPVAVKVIDARHRHKPEYARRLVQEARAVAQWRQENIVQVYYADSENDLFYFVMEYIDGADLRQILTDAAPHLLPFADVLRIGRGVAAALDYAHARGAIHRDVKPENVMVDKEGRVVLTDFGLVIEADGHQTGESFGSAAYIAPEQARSETPTVPQSDLYALGVMLYEMLTGHLPFDDPSAMSVAVQHISQPPPSPRTFNPALNEQTETVLLKALSKDPARRYQTGGDLMAALARALGDTATGDDLIGRQLDEYKLEALLGQGGMARIYRAQDVRLKRDVAVKIIDASLRADPEYRERFEREAQAIAQLSHPNIVNVFRYGETDGQFYLAMQYIDGSDLRHKLSGMRRAQTYLPLPEALRIVRQMGSALDYAHSKGIIHRDVKPANILLDNEEQIFLTDFGLVLRSDTATRGQVFGSPRYVAPEQAMSSAAAVPQSDLYALGVILYEMLTNQVPFDGKDPLTVAMMHMSERPQPPRDLRPDLSPALEAVVLRALAKEPEARFATGREMATALAAALEPQSGSSVDTPAPMPASLAADSGSPAKPLPGSAAAVKRPLPPIPAAVVIAEEEPPEPPAVASDKPQKRRRGCLPLLVVLLLILAGWGGWYLFLGGDKVISEQFSVNRDQLAGMPVVTPTREPTATLAPTETATLEPTETAVPTTTPTDSPTATLEPTDEPTAPPTDTPTSQPTDAPTETPTQTPTPSPTPLITITREKDGAVMVVIPASTFMMGAEDEDEMAGDGERPLHQVTLDSFQIDQFEVTVAQYAAFLNDIGGYVGLCNGFTCLSTGFETTNSHLINDTVSGDYIARPGQENTPINNVSWHGADAYCAWVGARLPTEAQWELAARGLDDRPYPWGSDAPDETLALFDAAFDDLQSVDALPDGASPFEVYGMAGSVWEWVADEYSDTFYAESPAENPANLSAFRVTDRVLRGGGYASDAGELRSTNRIPADPIVYQGIPDVGFRCAASVDE